MDHLEMVEKLREKANVSYEEARDALEAADWDLLDALLMLESEGRLNNENKQAEYTTRPSQPEKKQSARKKHGEGVVAQLMHGVAKVVRRCNAVTVRISKQHETRMELPLTAVILLVVFMFWWVLAAALIAMVFGYRYSIAGLRFDDDVNEAMDKAGDFVDKAVNAVPVSVTVVRNDDEDDMQSDENQ